MPIPAVATEAELEAVHKSYDAGGTQSLSESDPQQQQGGGDEGDDYEHFGYYTDEYYSDDPDAIAVGVQTSPRDGSAQVTASAGGGDGKNRRHHHTGGDGGGGSDLKGAATIETSDDSLSTSSSTESTTGEEEHCCSDGVRSSLAYILYSYPFIIANIAATVLTLFGGDFLLLALPKVCDIPYGALLCVCLVIFVFELIASLCLEEWRYFQFFFWLDLLAVAGIVPDVVTLFSKASYSSTSGPLVVARIARVARIASRGAKLLRVARLVTIVNAAENNRREEATEDTTARAAAEAKTEVGLKHVERATNTLIVIVLITIATFAIGDLATLEPNSAVEFGLVILEENSNDPSLFDPIFDQFVIFQTNLLRVRVRGVTHLDTPDLSQFRAIEIKRVSINDSEAVLDLTRFVRRDAAIGLCETIVVCIVMFVGNYFLANFAHDAVEHGDKEE